MYHTEQLRAHLPAGEYIAGYRDAERIAGYCRACANFGTVWSCPPYTYDTSCKISRFGYVHIVAVKVFPDETLRHSPHDAESMAHTSISLLGEVRRSFDRHLISLETATPDSLAFLPGSCLLCRPDKCTRQSGMPCRHPEMVRPSLEAFGFDMERTASELLHTPLRWSQGFVLPEYFTLIGALFSNVPTLDE